MMFRRYRGKIECGPNKKFVVKRTPGGFSRQLGYAIAKSRIRFYTADQMINIVSPRDTELLSCERA